MVRPFQRPRIQRRIRKRIEEAFGKDADVNTIKQKIDDQLDWQKFEEDELIHQAEDIIREMGGSIGSGEYVNYIAELEREKDFYKQKAEQEIDLTRIRRFKKQLKNAKKRIAELEMEVLKFRREYRRRIGEAFKELEADRL